MNLKQCTDKAIKLINEYSTSGTVTPDTDQNLLDYTLRFRILMDAAQKEIATIKKIHKVKKIVQNSIPSQLANPLYNFDVVQHLDTDKTYEAVGTKALTFKVDNVATMYIEEEIAGVWTEIEEINHTTPIGEFTEYKRLITATGPTNKIRLRFSGDYPYNIRDIAMFKYSFPSESAIPKYERYTLYEMPIDFYQLNKVVLKGNVVNSQQYQNTADFFWEKRNTIAIPYYNIGEYNVFYFAYPQTITDDTDDTYEFEIDLEAQEAIPYYVAAHVIMDEKSGMSSKLLALYQNKLANLDTKISNGSQAVENTLFAGTSGTKLF
jgi:hypothetical protein